MKQTFLTISMSLIIVGMASAQATVNPIKSSITLESIIDLTQVVDDKVPVIIDPGKFMVDTVTYRLPKVVQGTYTVSNFGSFIEEFKAYDYDGNELKAKKIDTNSWSIADGVSLDKITYLVNDTFDIENNYGQSTPFSPSGTNIEPENYVLNLHGFIGYFDSLKNSQYKLEVKSPATFKRSSALQKDGEILSEDGTISTTTYYAPRYFDITDNPMMYGNLDIEEFQVEDIKIVLSVYSPNKLHTAKQIKETILKMMRAQKAYLGDINTTARYDIFLYLGEQDEKSPIGYGALEHHTSTVVVMPEIIPAEDLAESMMDVVSHEFFHIVTPLSLHSEDIHYFDYNNPTFSKHLWMYEGVTEYFANLFQINQNLVSEDKFYSKILEKIHAASNMDDTMSFTEMSENVLEKPYSSNYLNVYQKGALIGMCIDILLREESNGERGILSLMKQLSLKYGINKPFDDDKLFEEITNLTYPSIDEFIKTYVVGNTPIDYNTFFEKVGLEISEGDVETNYIQNGSELIVGANQQYGNVFFNNLVSENSFWNEQGAQPRDIFKFINGEKVSLENINEILGQMFSWKPGDEIEVKLERNGDVVIIKTILTQSYTKGLKLKHTQSSTKKQISLRNAWLKG